MRIRAVAPAVVMTAAIALTACGGSSSGGTTSTGSSTGSSADSKPVVELTDLSKGVSTCVALDSKFLGALKSLTVTPGIVGKATLTGTDLCFPITGGNVKYYKPGTVNPYVQGSISHDGSGLSLSAGGTKVELTNFVVDPGTSMLSGKVIANGKTAVESTPLFFLDGSTLKPLTTEGDNGILEGTTVKILPAAAKLLETTYKLKTGTIPAYFTVGIAKITVATK